VLLDWGSAVVLPGLVNAHTHLELTLLHGRLREFSCFSDWLWQLMQERKEWTRDDYLESTRRGARMSLEAGTTLVGDISSSGVSWEALKPAKLRKVVFEEAISFQPAKAAEALAALKMRIGRVQADDLLCVGASPHAPYSVSPELYRGISNLASRKYLPLATHVAETTAELEFVRYGTGELRQFLARVGALPEKWEPPGLPPVCYLEKLGLLEQAGVLIHCNYLDEDSMTSILRGRRSVVYCPRSHAFFGHPEHPVRQLLNLGIKVALGTDSLASNDTLSVMDEMRFLFRTRKDLASDVIVRMATLNGAAALGFGSTLGRLRRGYWADMTIWQLPENMEPRNLTAQVLEGAGECIATIVRGEIAWRGGDGFHVP